MSSALTADRLSVSLAGRRVLSDIDVSVERGDFLVLLGGNGSGKTTFVRAVLGLVAHERGTVSLLGEPLESFDGWQKIGYVPQRLVLPLSMPATVAEVVLSGRIAHAGIWRRFSDTDRAAATRALEVADLEGVANERISRLSGGQQQRVLIARAMATEPELMILDEPVSSVDLAHQTMFASLLHEANRGGATVVLVAHALGAMSHLASRAIVLDGSRIVYDGPPEGTPQHDHAVHHHGLDVDQGLRPIGDER